MNQSKILKELQILRANNEAISNALTVLEKEVAGELKPTTTTPRMEKIRQDAAKIVARNRGLQIKKAAQGGS